MLKLLSLKNSNAGHEQPPSPLKQFLGKKQLKERIMKNSENTKKLHKRIEYRMLSTYLTHRKQRFFKTRQIVEKTANLVSQENASSHQSKASYARPSVILLDTTCTKNWIKEGFFLNLLISL